MEQHLRILIGDMVLRIAAQAAEIDDLRAKLDAQPKPEAAQPEGPQP